MKKTILKLLCKTSFYSMIGVLSQVLFLSFASAIDTDAQQIKSVKDVSVKIDAKTTRLIDVFSEIEKKTDFKFVYDKEDKYLYMQVDVSHNKLTIEAHLLQISKQTKLGFRQVNNSISVRQLNQNQRQEIEIIIQGRTITGKVTSDDDPEGLPGVNVLLKGSSTGTVTDIEGNFSLEVPDDNAVLVFSSVGYLQQEVVVGSQSVIDLKLSIDITTLGEIVVVGYGTQKTKDVTGAVKRVTNEDFNKGIVNNAGQLIQGKAAGVNVTSSSGEPGSGQRIIIRGQGTLHAGSGPLFVLDGFPLGLAGTGSGGSPLNFINPDDIETIDILKDASATAIYGARGANGVVIITTKKGKEGLAKVSFSADLGISNLAGKLPVFGADEFRKQVAAIPGNELIDGGGSTDWQDELTRSAITQNYNLVLSGGTNKLNYYASLGLQDQDGIVYNSGLKRTSARINVTQKLGNTNRFKIDYNLNTTVTEQTRNNTVGYRTNPTFDAYTSDGEINNPLNWNNPLLHNKYVGNFAESRRILINVAPSFEILDGLVYKMNVGHENRSTNSDSQTIANTERNDLGSLSQSFGNFENSLIENYLTYTFDKGDHNFSILGGHSYQKTFFSY